jgi:hypothetical protein
VAATTGIFYGQHMTAHHIYTVAGTGSSGGAVQSGTPATTADLGQPEDVLIGSAGNIVIADTYDFVIRVVAASTGMFYGQSMTSGDIYAIAGDATAGFSGDGGPATSAELHYPTGVALDGAGNVVVADSANRVRVVAENTGVFYGQAMKKGRPLHRRGTGTAGFSGDGGLGTKAEINSPDAVAPTPAGNILFTDTSNNRIREIQG